MRLSQNARRNLAGGSLLLAAMLVSPLMVSGCATKIDGRPVAAPAGPNFPTQMPGAAALPPTTPTSPNPAPVGPVTPAGAIPLPPDQNGYVFIETKSGITRCQINNDTVGCEAPFTNSPMQDGERANGVSISAGGSVQWVLGNLGAIPTVTIDYKKYGAQGWTIDATEAGTRFSNDRTGHGMFVSVEKVNTF